ncbi:acyl-CoA N-acyltransferase [Amylostereum chailletii]|nr:acyl-CoA N-acyltransferase [Amylostereum chailletii]
MFETTRLILRGYHPSDEGFFFSLYNEYNVLVNLTEGYATPSPDAHRQRLEAMVRCGLFVVIVDKESGQTMGFTLLQLHAAKDADADLGIGLSEKWWGKGYGTEVMEWLIQYAFDGMALRRLSLYVLQSNPRAVALYEKLGFKHEGRQRESVWKEGRYVDKIWMGLLKSEYRGEEGHKAGQPRTPSIPENTPCMDLQPGRIAHERCRRDDKAKIQT